MDAASKFRSMQADARVIKHYRSKVMKCITDSIQAKFDDVYVQNETDAPGFLDDLIFVYKDLIRIESDVTACFPPSYEIWTFFVREYHKALNNILNRLVQSEPPASAFLALHAWIKEYKKSMRELNIPSEWLEPPLLEGKEQGLIEDYLQLIIKKLDEWSENLMRTEVAAFTAREEPPEISGEGLYSTAGTVIFLDMVNQQIDLALESNQGLVLSRAVEEVNRVMRSIQDRWVKLVDAEYKKYVEKPEEVPGGLVEYCIALANDQIKAADFTEGLSARLEALVSDKYRVPIHDRLNDALDGYLDVAKHYTQTLINIIFHDLKPAVKQLFGPTWYEGTHAQIMETMRDYMTDYQAYLNESLFEVLVEDLLDTYLVTYLTALANSSKLIITGSPSATERMRQDIDEVYHFFGTYKKMKELQPQIQVLDQVLAMLEASKSFVFLSYWTFAQTHGPCVQFTEALMKARNDLDRSAVSEVMDSVKRKVKDENLTDREFLSRFLFPVPSRRF